MKEQKRAALWRRWLYFAGVGLGLLLFGWQLALAVANVRQRAVLVAEPGWLLIALALAVGGYLLQWGSWLLVMRFLRRALAPATAFSGYFLSFLPRYIPGTVWGYWGRSEWLARSYGIDYRTSGAGSLLEAGSFLALAATISVYAYAPAPWGLPAALLLLVGAVAAWPLLAHWLAGVRQPQPKVIPAALLAYFFYWWLQGLGLHALCRGLGISAGSTAAGIDLLHLTAASAASWGAGFLVLFVPAGFGVRELSLTYLLTAQGGMAPADANLLAVFSRASMIVAELLMLSAALVFRSRTADAAPYPPSHAPDAPNQ